MPRKKSPTAPGPKWIAPHSQVRQPSLILWCQRPPITLLQALRAILASIQNWEGAEERHWPPHLRQLNSDSATVAGPRAPQLPSDCRAPSSAWITAQPPSSPPSPLVAGPGHAKSPPPLQVSVFLLRQWTADIHVHTWAGHIFCPERACPRISPRPGETTLPLGFFPPGALPRWMFTGPLPLFGPCT